MPSDLIERGDEVHHHPSGEDWVVLRAGVDSDGEYVEPAGWPPCRARAADCTLTKKGAHVAFLDHHERKEAPMTLDEKIAAARYNARLYAAAPDLHRLALDLAADRERLQAALIGTTASLVAAISLFERGGKNAAVSDTMFAAMLKDYQAAVDKARAALAAAPAPQCVACEDNPQPPNRPDALLEAGWTRKREEG